MAAKATNLEFPVAFQGLFRPARYKVFYGGRGSGKSWNVARALILEASAKPIRVLCAREFQTSIRDSVHKLLADRIDEMGLTSFFKVTDKSITSTAGAEFLFKGLRLNIQEVKSTEGIDRCWVEEAQTVSAESWQTLAPTIRKPGSEVWITFNPGQDTDPTFQRYVLNADPDWIVQKVGWEDNPWFPDVLDIERRRDLAVDPDAYDWIWNGHCRKISEAVIFRNRVSVEPFETPSDARFHFGADWGFANDPTALVRCWIKDDVLYIDHEAFGFGVEIDHLKSDVFDAVPGSQDWPIRADSARPETISYVRRQGFNISPAEKWPGSVEDGVEHLRGFKRIVVHERCKHIAQEFRLYSYKVDRVTGDVLPIIVDKHNHGIDALRYALDGYIQGKRPMVISDAMLNRFSAPVRRRR